MSINSSVKNMTIDETVSVFENLSSKDLSLMEKSEVSKSLFADINWQEILRAGIFLTAKDVSAEVVLLRICRQYF
jgi:hypothetical protein